MSFTQRLQTVGTSLKRLCVTHYEGDEDFVLLFDLLAHMLC